MINDNLPPGATPLTSDDANGLIRGLKPNRTKSSDKEANLCKIKGFQVQVQLDLTPDKRLNSVYLWSNFQFIDTNLTLSLLRVTFRASGLQTPANEGAVGYFITFKSCRDRAVAVLG